MAVAVYPNEIDLIEQILDFVCLAIGNEVMFVLKRLPRPASGAIELGNQSLSVLRLDLVDPVHVAGQGVASPLMRRPVAFSTASSMTYKYHDSDS